MTWHCHGLPRGVTITWTHGLKNLPGGNCYGSYPWLNFVTDVFLPRVFRLLPRALPAFPQIVQLVKVMYVTRLAVCKSDIIF